MRHILTLVAPAVFAQPVFAQPGGQSLPIAKTRGTQSSGAAAVRVVLNMAGSMALFLIDTANARS